MHREPDVGFDPGSPGSRPGPKAGTKPLRHPGIPVASISNCCEEQDFLSRKHWIWVHIKSHLLWLPGSSSGSSVLVLPPTSPPEEFQGAPGASRVARWLQRAATGAWRAPLA
ncbi:hypothetical protein VULLAG_LOCUS22034 [Vulpes lagopus]